MVYQLCQATLESFKWFSRNDSGEEYFHFKLCADCYLRNILYLNPLCALTILHCNPLSLNSGIFLHHSSPQHTLLPVKWLGLHLKGLFSSTLWCLRHGLNNTSLANFSLLWWHEPTLPPYHSATLTHFCHPPVYSKLLGTPFNLLLTHQGTIRKN